MPAITRDVWFGLRILRRSPWFTAVAVLTLGLGIAVTATVFSWIDTVLLHPFPGVGDPQSLTLIETVTPTGEFLVNTSYIDYKDYRDNLRLVSGVALGRFTPLSVGADGRTARAWAELVSANYFDLLKVKPVLGRTFLPNEGRDQEGGAPLAVISHRMWQVRFGGDPQVLGKIIRLNRHPLTIIGVAPPEFHGTLAGVLFDVWIPVTMATAMGTGNGTLRFRGTRDQTSTIVRLKPGVTIEQARAEVAALGKRLAAIYPRTNRGIDLTVTPIWQGHLGAQGMLLQPLRILMALSLLLLLIVCANISNLLLARAVSRQREFGIRLAMGAALPPGPATSDRDPAAVGRRRGGRHRDGTRDGQVAPVPAADHRRSIRCRRRIEPYDLRLYASGCRGRDPVIRHRARPAHRPLRPE